MHNECILSVYVTTIILRKFRLSYRAHPILKRQRVYCNRPRSESAINNELTTLYHEYRGRKEKRARPSDDEEKVGDEEAMVKAMTFYVILQGLFLCNSATSSLTVGLRLGDNY